MRIRGFATPGWVATGLAVVAVGLAAGSVADVAVGLGLAVVGMLVGLCALQFGLLGGAALFGLRVHRVVIGFGGRHREWTNPRRTVVLRTFPVTVSVSVGPGRAPARPRMWCTGLTSALVGLGVAGFLGWRAFPAGSMVERGLAIGVAAAVAAALVPRRTPASTSTGWYLVGLPRLGAAEVAELDAAPLVNEAIDAVNAGDLVGAEAASARLAATHPELRSAAMARITVLEALGRYAEGVQLVLGLLADPDVQPRDAALLFAGLAGLATVAVEAGQLGADTALPIATQAMDNATALGYPRFKLTGTKAILELLSGEPATALRLAETASSVTDHPLTRADDLATACTALMALGNNGEARQTLRRAEALAPWWPRVAAVRARLDIDQQRR